MQNFCLTMLFSLLIHSVLAAQPILTTCDGNNRLAVFNDKQKLIWEHSASKPYYAELLPNGHILYSYQHGVKEISISGKELLNYKADGDVFCAQRLKNGNTLVGNCSKAQIVEINKKGEEIRHIHLKGGKGHGVFRHFNLTAKGTILVGQLADKCAREYDMSGKVIRELKVPGLCYKAIELKSGNILVAYERGVVEFDKNGKKVWELKDSDLPQLGIKFVTFLHETAAGELLIGNWLGHGMHGKGVPFFQITKGKKVTWTLSDSNAVKQATSLQVLTKRQLSLFKKSGSKISKSNLVWDFENGNKHGWEVMSGDLKNPVSHKNHYKAANGNYIISTLYKKNASADRLESVVESPVFRLSSPEISFVVGGGRHKETYIALCDLSGKELFSVRGKNSVELTRTVWDCSKYIGETVVIKLIDHHQGSWGHITADNFKLEATIDQELTLERRKSSKQEKALAEIKQSLDLDALEKAIKHLAKKYPKYPAKRFTNRLHEIKQKISSLNKTLKSEPNFVANVKNFQREALIANPLVSSNPILFVVRKQYKSDHHNTATLFQTGEINTQKYDPPGLIKTIDFSRDGEVKTIVNGGKAVLARDPEVHFSGKKIIFSMRKSIEDDYHIYEVNADGSSLKQLTKARKVSDIDPIYLPDNSIVFTSTREPKFCMCNRHIMGNLFKMEADGANIHQIGKSTLFEGHSSLMPDGRVMYDRWEYVDRNFGDAQGLWTVNPDGTNHAIYWGNNTPAPGGVIDGRIIPDTNKTICIFGSCHDRPWGSLAIIDRTKGVDGREPVVRTWPAKAVSQVGKGNWDAFLKFRPKYEDPFPLDKNFFLVSRSTGKGEQMGIYLVDTFGNETLLHSEGPGCYDPMPIRPYKRPTMLPTKRDFKNANGEFYVQDVYIGTHMKGVKRGSAKFLRVVEAPEKRSWSHQMWGGQGTIAPGMNWHDFSNKRILGTVPVEEDGSAYFEAPSDTFLFFQLLDKDGKMIQSMRSGTMLQSGENQGCIGCHEDRVKETPVMKKQLMALKRPPNKLNGWYGMPRLFNYLTEIQPIWNKNCLTCHDYGKKAEEKLLLAPDKTCGFNASYNELWRKKYVQCVGAGPSHIQPANSWGARISKLVTVLEKGHHDVKLSKEEWDRIITWVDINAPYYPVYDTAYKENLSGRCPLDYGQLGRLSKLTGIPFRHLNSHGSNRGPMVSFGRPELSRCLQKLRKGSDKYKEALAIITASKEMLKKKPRADMPGFVPCKDGRNRQKFYKERRQVELKNRKAIREGRKFYDKE